MTILKATSIVLCDNSTNQDNFGSSDEYENSLKMLQLSLNLLEIYKHQTFFFH